MLETGLAALFRHRLTNQFYDFVQGIVEKRRRPGIFTKVRTNIRDADPNAGSLRFGNCHWPPDVAFRRRGVDEPSMFFVFRGHVFELHGRNKMHRTGITAVITRPKI